MAVKVITDSTSDISPELERTSDVAVLLSGPAEFVFWGEWGK